MLTKKKMEMLYVEKPDPKKAAELFRQANEMSLASWAAYQAGDRSDATLLTLLDDPDFPAAFQTVIKQHTAIRRAKEAFLAEIRRIGTDGPIIRVIIDPEMTFSNEGGHQWVLSRVRSHLEAPLYTDNPNPESLPGDAQSVCSGALWKLWLAFSLSFVIFSLIDLREETMALVGLGARLLGWSADLLSGALELIGKNRRYVLPTLGVISAALLFWQFAAQLMAFVNFVGAGRLAWFVIGLLVLRYFAKSFFAIPRLPEKFQAELERVLFDTWTKFLGVISVRLNEFIEGLKIRPDEEKKG